MEPLSPHVKALKKPIKLLSSTVPIAGGQSVPINISPEFTGGSEQNIEDVAAFLSAAFLVDPHLAEELVHAFGGEDVLFGWFHKQTPWVTMPVIETNGEHGRTVRAYLYLVAEEYQGDAHKIIVSICETLIAISPSSDAAASDAIDPKGRQVKVGDYAQFSKNIPRENLPSKSRVAWNVAFRQILSARTAAGDSLTKYAKQMIELISETEKLFRSYTEKWISSKKIGNANALAAGMNKVIQGVNILAYTEPRPVSTSMTAVTEGTAASDTLGALLTGVLDNLMRRVSKLPSDNGAKGAAAFSGNLAAQARNHQQSTIWRTTSNPPIRKLNALAQHLGDVSCILHEMAHGDSPATIKGLNSVAKRASLGKSVHLVARRCRMQANQRLQRKLRTFEKNQEERGYHIQCWTRPAEEADSVYWPPVEITLLVEIADFKTDIAYLDECILQAQDVFAQEWKYRVVPIMEGKVLASFAMFLSSSILSSQEMMLLDVDFAKDWQDHIDHPFHSSTALDAFDEAMSACMQLSGIVNCRNMEELSPEEQDVTEKIIDSFRSSHGRLKGATTATGLEELDWFIDKVDSCWNRVVDEYETAKNGKTVSSPLYEGIYATLSGQESDWAEELGCARMLLQQAEIRAVI